MRFFEKKGVIRPIYEVCTNDVEAAYSKFECLGYPRGQRKTSMFSFYPTNAIGQFFPVIRVSQIKVNEGNQNRGDKFKSSRRYLV